MRSTMRKATGSVICRPRAAGERSAIRWRLAGIAGRPGAGRLAVGKGRAMNDPSILALLVPFIVFAIAGCLLALWAL